eukprot:2420055-Pleurochrysis_carterae.AAC.3
MRSYTPVQYWKFNKKLRVPTFIFSFGNSVNAAVESMRRCMELGCAVWRYLGCGKSCNDTEISKREAGVCESCGAPAKTQRTHAGVRSKSCLSPRAVAVPRARAPCSKGRDATLPPARCHLYIRCARRGARARRRGRHRAPRHPSCRLRRRRRRQSPSRTRRHQSSQTQVLRLRWSHHRRRARCLQRQSPRAVPRRTAAQCLRRRETRQVPRLLPLRPTRQRG